MAAHHGSPAPSRSELAPGQDARSLRDLSARQWKSGAAAWLGWLFDGLDLQLYVLVATPFVAELLGVADTKDQRVGFYSSWIQAAFLFGWALGGGFFGRVADRLGRSRALMLTILTYALFTGLSYFAQTWWQLLLFRFLAALGIGGEWAVGASLLSETWPRRWRPWMAAVLQTGVNLGIMLAALANYLRAEYALPNRTVFLVGVLPALLVLWIRRAVPEPEEWQGAKRAGCPHGAWFPAVVSRPVTAHHDLDALCLRFALTAHWAFGFWYLQHLRNLPELAGWTDDKRSQLVSKALWLVIGTSIAGNFLAAWLARWIGYRRAITFLCLAYFLAMLATYSALMITNIYGMGMRRSACARGYSPCSRCIFPRSSRRSCERQAPDSASTSAALPRAWVRSFSASLQRWVIIVRHSFTQDSCSCRQRQ